MDNSKIESIIKAYGILKSNNSDTWLEDCSNAKSIKGAIELAATAKNLNDKKHPHQYRIPNSVLDEFAMLILRKGREINKVKTFDDLINIIQACKIKGVSELTIYDTAQRIGVYLKVYPTKIYLHRGTRVGAEKLLGKISGRTITKNDLPSAFQNSNLTPSQIEDLLCIYKGRL